MFRFGDLKVEISHVEVERLLFGRSSQLKGLLTEDFFGPYLGMMLKIIFNKGRNKIT